MKTVIKFIIGIIVLVLIAYMIIINLPKASSTNKTASLSISATELFSEFSSDEAKANKKYIGKIIEVEGTVLNTHRDKQNALVIILDSGDAMGSVLCTLEKDPAEIPQKSQHVSIKGQCNGLLMDVVLNKCILLNS